MGDVLADGGVGEPCERTRRSMVRNSEEVGPQVSKSRCCSSRLQIGEFALLFRQGGC